MRETSIFGMIKVDVLGGQARFMCEHVEALLVHAAFPCPYTHALAKERGVQSTTTPIIECELRLYKGGALIQT